MIHAKRFRLAQVATVCTLSLMLAAQDAPVKSAPAAAVITSISGGASYLFVDKSVSPHKKRSHSVELYEWLPQGATLHIPAGSLVAVAFINGKRYELSGVARATITTAGPVAQSGSIRELPQAQVLQPLAAIADIEKALSNASPGIRAVKIGGLYPAPLKLENPEQTLEVASLPDQTVLRFTPDPQASSYRVAIEDESGAEIFQSEISGHEISIRPGLLRAGRRYSWTVKAVSATGASPDGRANFKTLTFEQIAKRSAWQKAWEESKNPNLLVSMAGIDYRLGLFAAALEEQQNASEIVAQSQH